MGIAAILIEPVGIETSTASGAKQFNEILIEPVGIETVANGFLSKQTDDFNRTSWN